MSKARTGKVDILNKYCRDKVCAKILKFCVDHHLSNKNEAKINQKNL